MRLVHSELCPDHDNDSETVPRKVSDISANAVLAIWALATKVGLDLRNGKRVRLVRYEVNVIASYRKLHSARTES